MKRGVLLSLSMLLHASAAIDIVNFDHRDLLTSWNWRILNDPVMGGQSKGTFEINDGVAVFDGNCAIVPALKAPGFCNAETKDGNRGIEPKGIDARGATHLLMDVKSTIEYSGFKVSLAADTTNPQFESFKADFEVPADGEWTTVSIPFNEFSNKWSMYTGEPLVKCVDDESVCISEANKEHFSQVGLWAEGIEGDFHLEVRSIRAENIENLVETLHSVSSTQLVEEGPSSEPCCNACSDPAKKKYYSIDLKHGFCGETCIKPSSYQLFKVFEPTLEDARGIYDVCAQNNYSGYHETVTHGFGPLKITLDLYSPDVVPIAGPVDIATFDGVDPLTTWKWRELNDPVMGGKSTGSIDIIDNAAVFTGTCAIVDKLNAPGFCVAETTDGFGIVSKGIDASARSHLVMEVRSSMEYTGFKISLAANTFNPQFASFKANLDIPVTDDFITIKVPFTDFSNKWSSYTGEATVKCVDDESVCISEKNKKSFANIGIWAEGVEGDFKLEVRSIRAENIESKEVEAAAFLVEAEEVEVVTFDGVNPLSTWKFREVNDPVMGGQSTGGFEIVDGVGIFTGNCAIVPSLKAPGFCKTESTDGFGLRKKGIDASGKSHIAMEVRSSIAYEGFKIAFTADTFSSFFSYKANVNIPVSEDFITVTVPFNEFSNKWSAATGEAKVKCADDESVCMTEKNKKHFSQVGFWAEGHEGAFKLEIKSVKAINLNAEQAAAVGLFLTTTTVEDITDPNKHCTIQTGLRYNMDSQDSIEQMFPIDGDAGETLGAAICCDDRFNIFAEPQFLYERPDIGFLTTVGTEENPTTYYDSACGLPVFKAPVGRTAAEFLADTEEHGWPSFRPAELIGDNVHVLDDNRVVSKCGTMLGSFLPDEQGDRYCIDTVCVSGNPIA